MEMTTGVAVGVARGVVKAAPKAKRAYRLFTTFDHTWLELESDDGSIIALTAQDVEGAEAFLQSREVRALLRLTVAILVSPDSDERREALKAQSVAFGEMAKRATVNVKAPWVKHADVIWQTVLQRVQASIPATRLDSGAQDEAEVAGDFLISPLAGATGTSYFRRLRDAASNLALIAQVDDLVAELTTVAASDLKRPMLGHLDVDYPVNQAAIYVDRLVRLEAQGTEIVADSNMFDGTSFHRTVLLGNPGAGKTTLVHHLSLGGRAKDSFRNPILILRCIDYAREHAKKSILTALSDVLDQVYGIHEAQGALDAALTFGAIDIIFDGLDEITSIPIREEFCDRVNKFAVRYATTSILVTSREIGYSKAPLDQGLFARANLLDFSPEQIQEYSERWFTEVQRPELVQPFASDVRSVMDLAINPLLLSLLCSLYRANGTIPRKRRAIYKQCADLLFTKWDGGRQIQQNEDYPEFGQRLFEEIARFFWSTASARKGIEAGQLIRLIGKYLADYTGVTGGVAETRAREFLEYCAGRAWLLAVSGTERGEPLFAFTHRTFYEFFTAEAFVRSSENAEEVGAEIVRAHQLDDTSVLPELLIQAYEEARDRGATRVFKAVCKEPGVDVTLVLRLMSTNLRADARDNGFVLLLDRWEGKGEASDSEAFSALLRVHLDPKEHFVRTYLHGDDENARRARTLFLIAWASSSLSGSLGHDARLWEEDTRVALSKWLEEWVEPAKRPRVIQHWLILNGMQPPETLGVSFGLLVRVFGDLFPGGLFQALYPSEFSHERMAITQAISDYIIQSLGSESQRPDRITREEAALIGPLFERTPWPSSMVLPLDAGPVAKSTVALALMFEEVGTGSPTLNLFLHARLGIDINKMGEVRRWNRREGPRPSNEVGQAVMSKKQHWPHWASRWLTGEMTICSDIERYSSYGKTGDAIIVA